jgi:hypothetical protein
LRTTGYFGIDEKDRRPEGSRRPQTGSGGAAAFMRLINISEECPKLQAAVKGGGPVNGDEFLQLGEPLG